MALDLHTVPGRGEWGLSQLLHEGVDHGLGLLPSLLHLVEDLQPEERERRKMVMVHVFRRLFGLCRVLKCAKRNMTNYKRKKNLKRLFGTVVVQVEGFMFVPLLANVHICTHNIV